jgi:integrase
MPRHGKGPRLYFRRARRSKDGQISHKPRWVIRDGAREVGTQCGYGDGEQAEKALADYIGNKYQPSRKRGRDPASIPIADVLNIYLNDIVPGHARPNEGAQRAEELLGWWGDKVLEEINKNNCRRYVAARLGKPWKSSKADKTGNPPRLVTTAAARRELEDLRAAINYYHQQGYCSEGVKVWLPEPPPRRERWLTRAEAAKQLRAFWRAKDPLTERHTRRHAARFFLVGLYHGTRAGAVCGAAVRPTIGYGHVDLAAELFYRTPTRARRNNKNQNQTPAPIPKRLLAHMRRWVRLGISRNFIVEWHGKPVKSVRTAWESAREEAGLDPEVVRHTLRHTAATWLMQAGTNPWTAAGYLGMSVETLIKNYGHHHPDYQREAAANICAPPQKRPRYIRTDQEHAGPKRQANG